MRRLGMQRVSIEAASTVMVALWSYATEHEDEMAADLHELVAEAQEVYLAVWEDTDSSGAEQ